MASLQENLRRGALKWDQSSVEQHVNHESYAGSCSMRQQHSEGSLLKDTALGARLLLAVALRFCA